MPDNSAVSYAKKISRILFVDDDVLTLDLMSKAVRLLGHEPIVCASGNAAIRQARENRPDLIMVDLVLSDTTGYHLIEDLHAQKETAHIPVVLVTAGTGPNDEKMARQAGASGFLVKPLVLSDLARVIQQFTPVVS